MSVKLEDRPIETLRSEVIDRLVMNYSHGEISYQAFERRLDQAMATEHHSTLQELVQDLPLEVDQQFTANKQQEIGASFSPGVTEAQETIVNVFSGSSRSGPWQVPREIRSFSLFSGGDLDFSEARFCHPQLTIKMLSLFSGENIYVPENVNVVSKAFCIFGGIENRAQACSNPNAPTIIIEGLVIFSGIDIKLKKTVKERFVAFAENLKKLFS